MYKLIFILKLILSIIFLIYEFFAFKSHKSLKYKLFPLIIVILLSIFTILFTSLCISIGYYYIFLILFFELCLIGIILVLMLEVIITLLNHKLNFKKLILLSLILVILIIVYFLGKGLFNYFSISMKDYLDEDFN